ncbi:MAG: efflux RND transporter periplasmic adaptor subunit [Gammaproteobacteria bacterium]|nr:efflux RND transporter periplasmic adaptor subunit [Gammaproteobacteria bacterium]
MNKALSAITLLIIGAAAGAIGYSQLMPSMSNQMSATAEKQPMYWVAPMDANYRRDKAGKSPMGMDLIAVYDDGANDSPGTIKISPNVINNLGVRSAKVTMDNFSDRINTVGYIGYDEDKLVHIHPRVEGWLDKLYIKNKGAQVKKGKPLYDIYSPALVNAQEELVLALDRKNKRLIRAAKGRLKALLVPQQAIDKLVKSRQVQQNVTIFAPQSGVIDNLSVREGFFVKPGTSLMSIGSLDDVWVNAQVFERQSALVNVGDKVTMTLDYLPGRSWQGEVDYIYPTLDAKTRTVQLRLRFANPDYMLKPNMYAQVAIDSISTDDVLIVPREAVIRTGNSNRVVMSLGEGKFKSVKIKTGRSNATQMEVIEGLALGDLVVTSAQFLLDSESSVSSDFIRMDHQSGPQQVMAQSVWTTGVVESVMKNHRMVTLTHPPIAEWDWPEMTMDFIVAQDVDIDLLAAGGEYELELSQGDNNQYLITGIKTAGGVDHSKMAMSSSEQPAAVQSVWTTGVIESLMVDHRMATITHPAIEQWQWPPMTMDFTIGKQVDMSLLTEGLSLHLEITKAQGKYIISNIHIEQ